MNQMQYEYTQSGGKLKVRPSPSTSATLYKTGTKKTGNDGNVWAVVENVNGIKRWKRYKNKKSSKTKNNTKSKTKTKSKSKSKPTNHKVSDKQDGLVSLSVLDFYDVTPIDDTEFKNVCKKSNQLVRDTINNMNDFVKAIKKMGMLAHVIPLALSSNGIYWSDYPGDYLSEIYGPEWYETKKGYMYFTVYMNQTGTEINDKEDISVSFSDMNAATKKTIFDLLNKYLKDRYSWSGRNTDRIRIHYVKSKGAKIDLTTLKDNDAYPWLNINLNFPKTMDLFKSPHIVMDLQNILIKLMKIDNDTIGCYESYGMTDVMYDFNGVETKLYKKYISNVVRYLDDLIKSKTITRYNINFYIDKNTISETFRSK